VLLLLLLLLPLLTSMMQFWEGRMQHVQTKAHFRSQHGLRALKALVVWVWKGTPCQVW
jgi:hypothetical protein